MKRGFLKQNNEKRPISTSLKLSRNDTVDVLTQAISNIKLEQQPQTRVVEDEVIKISNDEILVHREFRFPSGLRCQAFIDRDLIDFLPKQPTTVSPTTTRDILYRISDAGDKGFGMFATRDIPACRVILEEHPVVMLPKGNSTLSRSDVFAKVASKMRSEERTPFLQLANIYPEEMFNAPKGIVLTNAISAPLNAPKGMDPDRSLYCGVFLDISICNHSCGPNATHSWDPDTLSLTLYSTRPIHTGEEICIAYMHLDFSRKDRHARLSRDYNFICECKYCSVPDVAKSDRARQEIGEFRDKNLGFIDWVLKKSYPNETFINAHKRAIILIVQEGMETQDYFFHVDNLAMAYAAMKDEKNFMIWARRAYEYLKCLESPSLAKYEKGCSDPKSFPMWGWRTRDSFTYMGETFRRSW